MRDYKYGDFYFDSQHDKQMKIDVVGTGIVIDNSMIEMEAFELDEALCSESELKFGCCEANCVKFTARNLPGSIKGNEISITETIDGNTDEPFPYGKYKVQSDVPTSDRTKREITSYDAMYDIINADMKSWYAGLPFPMPLRQFRDRFFAYFGITQKETTLVNDGMTVNKTLIATQTDSESTITEESSISGKTVIEAICEINGVFGNINHDGEFEYVELEPITQPLYPSNDLYPREDLFPRDPNTISMTGHYITFDYEDFRSKAITQLEIRQSDDSAGVIVGTSGNNYVISGNFLVSDKTGAELETIAENTLSVIKKAAYIPIKSSEIVGNPCIELGDPIRFNTTREIVESYVLQRTLTGIQSKRDSITSLGTETHSQNPNGIKGQIESVTRRTNKLERTADHTLSELADLDASTSSRFEQTAEQIQTEVSNRQNADNEMLTKVSQTAHSIALVASGGDNSVGITIQLYDENGNLIDTDSGNANINIVGFVTFSDLAGNGTTTINGNNIKTGTISCDLLSGGTINGQKIVLDNGWTLLTDTLGNNIYGILSRWKGTNSLASTSGSNDWFGVQKFKSQTTLSGDISAPGVKNRTSTAVANVRCQDGTNSWLAIASSSSMRYKHNISEIVDAKLDPHRLYQLPPRQYKYNIDYIDKGDQRYNTDVCGFIAEEIHNVYPIACEYNENGEPENWNERYVIPPMLALIQEQHKDIELLKQENLALQNKLSILESRMEELYNVINNQNN